jgi:hypothetical protein
MKKQNPHLEIIEIEMDRLSKKINDKNLFVSNILKFCKLVRIIESDNNCLAKNKTSSAKGCYQFIDSALKTAYNRLNRYYNAPFKPILDCSKNEQTALFLADMFQKKGTDNYLLSIGNDFNMIDASALYSKFHHTNPDQATIIRMNEFFHA